MNTSSLSAVRRKYLERLEEDVKWSITCDLPLSHLWDLIQDFSESFEERTEAFFMLFKELLRRGHLKLQRDGKVIDRTPEEWEAVFRAVWPQSDTPYRTYKNDIHIWFTDDDCPAYAVWVDPEDGSEYWAG